MEWLEVSVRAPAEAAEAVAEVLSRYAPAGVAFDLGIDEVPETVVVTAYLTVDEEIEERRQKVAEGLWHLNYIWPVISDPIFRFVPDQDWSANWKEQISTIHLSERVVIKPSWRDYKPKAGEVVLEMDPGMAFGTGLHPTTQLCVSAVEDLIRPGMHVLDLGTGTGILAMIAAKLGAEKVTAVDIDENAVVVARRNVRKNKIAQDVEVSQGSLADAHGRYELVLANILASVIMGMATAGLSERVTPGGVLVASGVLEEQADDVTEALNRNGFRVTDQRQKGEWVALIARRRSGPSADVRNQS